MRLPDGWEVETMGHLRRWGWGRGVWLLLAVAWSAEAQKSRDKDVLPMRVVEAVTCRTVTDGGELLQAVDPADRFLTSEKQVASYVRFQHVFKPHRLQWKWYDPDGKLYTQSSELPVTLSGKYHEYYTGTHAILVQGERAMLLPGEWRVVVFLDGVIATSTSFTLSNREVGP
jgi:hypothetical protein